MTKQEKTEKVAQKIMEYHNERQTKTYYELAGGIVDALDDQPADDIPLGAPCEVWDEGKSSRKLRYYAGNGEIVIFSNDIGKEKAGCPYDYIVPIDIWRIPVSEGGPPKWAIARAYDETETIWCRGEEDTEYYGRNGFTIERRPEEI